MLTTNSALKHNMFNITLEKNALEKQLPSICALQRWKTHLWMMRWDRDEQSVTVGNKGNCEKLNKVKEVLLK